MVTEFHLLRSMITRSYILPTITGYSATIFGIACSRIVASMAYVIFMTHLVFLVRMMYKMHSLPFTTPELTTMGCTTNVLALLLHPCREIYHFFSRKFPSDITKPFRLYRHVLMLQALYLVELCRCPQCFAHCTSSTAMDHL